MNPCCRESKDQLYFVGIHVGPMRIAHYLHDPDPGAACGGPWWVPHWVDATMLCRAHAEELAERWDGFLARGGP